VNDYEKASNAFEIFIKNHDLKWDSKKKKWNKKFHQEVYDNGKFKRWKLGPRKNKTCQYCGKLLIGKQEKYCKPQHKTLHNKIIKIAIKKFKLKNFDVENDDPKEFVPWAIMIPPLYEFTESKTKKLFQKQIKDRRERKDFKVFLNGKPFPLTEKSRALKN